MNKKPYTGVLPVQEIRNAAAVMHEGGVIAYPTEGVWGLGCDPWNMQAVEKILHMKRRPVDKGLILVAADMKQISPLLKHLDAEQLSTLKASWPGPNTWLLPDPDQYIPPWIKGKFDTVAIRVSDHPLVQKLCIEFGGPIVSTSANPGSRPPALTRLKVLNWFAEHLDYLVPGRLGGQNGPSAIRNLGDSTRIR